MPTLDDLRAVLGDRERYAGDPDTVLAALDNPPSRRHILAPLLAAAAVVALAAGALTLARSDDSSTTPATGGPRVSFDWTLGFDPVPGYDVARVAFSAQFQLAKLTPKAPEDPKAFVTVYAPGQTPKEIDPGRAVTVDGKPGFFVDGTPPRTIDSTMSAAWDDPDSFARLRWQYEPGAWIEIEGTFGYQPDLRSYDNDVALARERDIAAAVHVDRSDPVTMPFALRDLPDGLTPVSANPGRPQTCIEYDNGSDDDPYSVVLTVCRTTDAEAHLPGSQDQGRVLRQNLGDGTTLVLIASADNTDELLQSDLQELADRADVSPALDDTATWLPVR